jgi:putative ABC transport system permease protein
MGRVNAPRFVLVMAWREARGSGRRTLFLAAAIAVGVGALVAVNSFTDNLGAALRREARTLLGADLDLSSGSPLSGKAEALLEELRSAASSAGKEARLARVVTFGAMAWIPGGTAARLVQVVAGDPGYPFYGEVETSPPGEWDRLTATGGALVDPSLLAALGAREGDTLRLGEAGFVVRGRVQSLPGDVGLRGVLGPRVFVPRARVGETGLLTRGSRARYDAYLRLAPGVDARPLADRFREPLLAERVTLRTVSEDERRLEEVLARVGRFLGLVALVALLLGGLGVASAVHVFVRRHLPTVAVLRCLGASAPLVLAVYVVQAAAVGLAGSVVGAALGVVVQLALPRVLGDFLPVAVEPVPSPPAVAGGVLVGVWVAAVFSLLPLLAVRRVSPLVVLRRDYEEVGGRDPARLAASLALALSVTALAALQAGHVVAGLAFAAGIGVGIGALWLAALLLVRGLRRSFPSRLPYLWRQGLANLYRPANQTVMVVLALGFGAHLLATLLLVQHNLLRDLRVERGAARPNLVFFDVQGDQREDLERRLAAAGSPAFPAVPIVPMRVRAVKGVETSRLVPSGPERWDRWALRTEQRASYRDRLGPAETVLAGRWWEPGEGRRVAPGAPVPVSLDGAIARSLDVRPGDEVVWDVQGVAVRSRVESVRDVEWARFEPNFLVLFPEGPLDDAPQTWVLAARLDDPVRRARFQGEVVRAHPNVSTLDLAQVQEAIEAVLDRVVGAVRFLALFSLAAGAVVLVGAVAASRAQRVLESALLRTLGATRPQLVRILLAEYAVLGALAAGTAILLSAGAGWAVVRFALEQPFSLPGPSLAVLVLAVVALTVLVGLFGSTDAWRRPPLEVLREE